LPALNVIKVVPVDQHLANRWSFHNAY